MDINGNSSHVPATFSQLNTLLFMAKVVFQMIIVRNEMLSSNN